MSGPQGATRAGQVAPQTAGPGTANPRRGSGFAIQSAGPAICGRIRISYFLTSRHSLMALVRASPVKFLSSAAFSHAFCE